jgi:hypothetical protein
VGGPTTSADLDSLNMVPSTPISWTIISLRPDTPAGTMAFRPGSPISGTAQEPGAIA